MNIEYCIEGYKFNKISRAHLATKQRGANDFAAPAEQN